MDLKFINEDWFAFALSRDDDHRVNHYEKSIPLDAVAYVSQDWDAKHCFICIKEEHRKAMGLRPVDQWGIPEDGFIALGSLAELRDQNKQLFEAPAPFFQFTEPTNERSISKTRQHEVLFLAEVIEEVSPNEQGQGCFVLIKQEYRQAFGFNTCRDEGGFSTPNSYDELRAKNPGLAFPIRPASETKQAVQFGVAPAG